MSFAGVSSAPASPISWGWRKDTFTQSKHMLLAMILVFALPTIVLFLARLRLVVAAAVLDHARRRS